MTLFWVALLVWLGLGPALAAWPGQPEVTLAIGPGAAEPDQTTTGAPARQRPQAADEATSEGEIVVAPPPAAPIVVEVGLRIDQITSIDQKAENFGIVGDLRLKYRDPKLAFNEAECACSVKLLHPDEVIALAKQQRTAWPESYFSNKQGRIFFDIQLAEVFPDGTVEYFERFSATFQAPDFDFRRFPFDDQLFFVRVASFFPEEYIVFADMGDWSGLGNQLGEEEWVPIRTGVIIDTIEFGSRISFFFEARRHITYYIFRLFIPIIVIITVSWFIFFLRDYSKRIDIATTNLLLFIAYNFVISGDLPRLGYLTFLDAILASTFVITGVIVMVSVFLRRLELNERTDLARTIDRYVLWCYPIGYALGIGAVVAFYFT